MSERASWMPKKIEMEHASREYSATAGWFLFDRLPLEGLIRAAVEKALAEQALALEASEKAHDVVRDICARAGVHHPEVILRQRDEARKQLAEQEARHRREVLEAKIDALDDLWHATKRDHSGKAVEVAFASHVTPSFIREEVDRLAAELAALDAGEGVKP